MTAGTGAARSRMEAVRVAEETADAARQSGVPATGLVGAEKYLRQDPAHPLGAGVRRYAAVLSLCGMVRALGAQVIMSVQDPLPRLVGTLGGGVEVVGGDAQPEAFDYHCPMMSLPLALGTTLETIAAPTRYLAADPAAAAGWRGRMAASSGLRVGLCWAGNALRPNPSARMLDRRRSIALAQCAPLAGVAGVHFVSLQKGDAAAQAVAPEVAVSLRDWMDELDDFADTAALIEALDLVITVNTSVAHVAGAPGKPVLDS